MGSLRETIRRKFRYVTILIHSVVIIFCMCVFFPLGSVTNYFESQCVLFSEPVFGVTGVQANMTATVDISNSKWGSPSYCYLTTFVPVVVAINSFIWCWFYIQMTTIHDESQVLCALIISAVLQGLLFIAVLISSGILSVGFSRFCTSLTNTLGNQYTCSETQDWNWNIFAKKHKFYTLLSTSVVFSWLVSVVLLLQSVLSAYFSFQLVNKTYMKVFRQSSEEKVTYTNENMTYSQLSYNDDTGSLMFDLERSHKTMESQHDVL